MLLGYDPKWLEMVEQNDSMRMIPSLTEEFCWNVDVMCDFVVSAMHLVWTLIEDNGRVPCLRSQSVEDTLWLPWVAQSSKDPVGCGQDDIFQGT